MLVERNLGMHKALRVQLWEFNEILISSRFAHDNQSLPAKGEDLRELPQGKVTSGQEKSARFTGHPCFIFYFTWYMNVQCFIGGRGRPNTIKMLACTRGAHLLQQLPALNPPTHHLKWPLVVICPGQSGELNSRQLNKGLQVKGVFP